MVKFQKAGLQSRREQLKETQVDEVLDDFSMNPQPESKENTQNSSSEDKTPSKTSDAENSTVIENLVNMVKPKGRPKKSIALNRPYQKSIKFDEETHRRMSMIKAFYNIDQQDLALYAIKDFLDRHFKNGTADSQDVIDDMHRFADRD